jgi:hypothetical protein
MHSSLPDELLRIDEAWKADEESFKVSYGARDVIPRLPETRTTIKCVILGMLGIICGAAFGVLFVYGRFFTFLLGAILAPASLGMMVYYVSAYRRYSNAYRTYQRRRADAFRQPET